MSSATTGWAVGQVPDPTHPNDPNAGQRPVLVRYADGDWQRSASPLDALPLHASYVGALAVGHDGTGWLALSSYDTGAVMAQGHDGLLLRLQGDRWQMATLPMLTERIAYHINGVAMMSSGAAWAVGTAWWPYTHGMPNATTIGLASTATPLILRFGNGVWSVALA